MRLEQWLKEHDISREEFARRGGWSFLTIGKWIRGERFPRPDALARITSLTDGAVQPNDFMREDAA